MESKIVIFLGPSGIGKSTVINALREKYPKSFTFSVSHTTREPRGYEVNGEHYHFVSEKEFNKMVENGEFLEHTYCHHNFYGTSFKAIKECFSTGRTLLLDLDLNGVKSLKENPDFTDRVFTVLMTPVDKEILKERISKRKSESVKSFITRSKSTDLQMVQFALEENQKYFDIKLINDVLEDTIKKIEAFLREKKVID